MTTPYTSINFNLALSILGVDPLILSGQPLAGRPSIIMNQAFPNGLAASAWACDDYFVDYQRTLAASASQTYVISELLDSINRENPFVDIRIFCIGNIIRTAGDHLTWGPGATHGWTPLLASGTQEIFDLMLHVCGSTDSWPVVANTTDQITVTNTGSHTLTYSLLLGGNTA